MANYIHSQKISWVFVFCHYSNIDILGSKLGYNFEMKKIYENFGSINLTNIDNLITIVHVKWVMLSIFYQRTTYLMVPFFHIYTDESKFIRCFQIAFINEKRHYSYTDFSLQIFFPFKFLYLLLKILTAAQMKNSGFCVLQ